MTKLLDISLPTAQHNKMRWGALHGASMSLAILRTLQEHKGLVTVIAPNISTKNRIANELRFFDPNIDIINLKDRETLPYDAFSPHQDIISERISALFRLGHTKHGILLTTITTIMHRLAPPDFIHKSTFILDIGNNLDINKTASRLAELGYQKVNQVAEHGEFAVRGSIFDIFPTGSKLPYRIDLFDDEVDSIRSFNPETQRSLTKIKQIRLHPAKEFPLEQDAVRYFTENWYQEFPNAALDSPVLRDLQKGFAAAGLEYYLPLFFAKTAVIPDYLPDNTLVILAENIEQEADRFWHDIEHRYDQYSHDITRPILAPHRVFIPTEEIFRDLKLYSRIEIKREKTAKAGSINFQTAKTPEFPLNLKSGKPLSDFERFIGDSNGRILITAESKGRKEALLELLKELTLNITPYENWHEFVSSDAKLGITVYPLEDGMVLPSSNVAIIAEALFYGRRIPEQLRKQQSLVNPELMIKNLAELKIGQPVVHIDHGIGIYQGLKTMVVNGVASEFLHLAYKDSDKLYIPITALHTISRYSGQDIEHVTIHRLGGDKWQKAKKKALAKIYDVAAELLEIYAKRSLKKGFAFKIMAHEYQKFSDAFLFEETEDQAKAIREVLADMQAKKPMDRLICGDVGFGKTEVAMRAAFVAALNGKQIAVLVPTTLLARQHGETFQDRFADWPINMGVISRFNTTAEHNRILSRIKNGTIDIVIGTHKLLQKDIKFKSLGLLIIDEEHRFGVRQKESLRSLRAEVDILALTATPIPRTLNLSLNAIRDISIITTPPPGRLAIKTFIREYDNKSIIKEALMRELMRGGQGYFLHNDVDTIAKTRDNIQQLLPDAKIAFAHGQMPKRELEHIMSDFYHRKSHILVCTTIIESGIDIPNANTIIINRADKLGLAELHQLRGRVGRSHHQAYAYLLTPPKRTLNKGAIKRLNAISTSLELGIGFMLATHDLEIRGAGELLGKEQSGNISAIGFSLYSDLLERAVKSLKAGKKIDLTAELSGQAEINLGISALLPEDYIFDVHTRLELYKRIADTAADKQILNDIKIELIDRFGPLPIQAKNLLAISRLRQRLTKLGIKKIEANDKGGFIDFLESTTIDPKTIINLIQLHPQCYKLTNPTRLRFILDEHRSEERIGLVEEILRGIYH